MSSLQTKHILSVPFIGLLCLGFWHPSLVYGVFQGKKNQTKRKSNSNKLETKKKEKKKKNGRKLDRLLSASGLLLSIVSCTLYRTDSRWSQNTRTSSADITLSPNALWSFRERNPSKISSGLWKMASKERKPFRLRLEADKEWVGVSTVGRSASLLNGRSRVPKPQPGQHSGSLNNWE